MKQLLLIGLLFALVAFNRNHAISPLNLKGDTNILDRSKIHKWMGKDMPDSVTIRWNKQKDSFSIHGLTFYVIHDTAWRSPNMPK